MCHKLLQAYACGHKRIVCTTPCPHAIATGCQIPNDLCKTVPDLSRSSSAVSSMTPSADASPLRATVLSSEVQGLQQSGHTPAFRSIAPTTGQQVLRRPHLQHLHLPINCRPLFPMPILSLSPSHPHLRPSSLSQTQNLILGEYNSIAVTTALFS